MYCCQYCSQSFTRRGLTLHEASGNCCFAAPAHSELCSTCGKAFGVNGFATHANTCKSVASVKADAARLHIAEHEADVLGGDGDGEVGANGDTAIGAYARAHPAEIKLLALCRDFNIPRRGADELIDWHHNNGHLGSATVQSIRAGLERTVSAAELGYKVHKYDLADDAMKKYLQRDSIVFKCRSPLAITRDLLSKENLLQNARWYYQEKVNSEGERIYEHLNTGLWWKQTEEKVREAHGDVGLVPIILYLDGTWLSKNGRHNAKPISMSLGNFDKPVYNQDASKRVIGYMPPLPASAQVRKKAYYKREKRRMEHHVLAAMLEAIQHSFDSGGFTMEIEGRGQQTLVPVIALVVQDQPEGQLQAGVSSGCRFCMLPKSQFSDVDAQAEERVAAESEELRAGLLHRINTSRDRVQHARDELKQNSLHDIRPAFADLPFGALPGGFYAALPSDRMHLWWEGIAKHLVDWVAVLI